MTIVKPACRAAVLSRWALAFGALALGFALAGPLWSAEAPKPKAQDWSFNGLFGTFDRAAQQRGFQVYKEVCSVCHSLNQVAYRNLSALGYNEDQVKAIAASVEMQGGPNEAGEMFIRKGKPFDKFKNPFPNENAARAANNGAFPPDLSVMTKARPHGADYLYALLTNYQDEPPKGVKLAEGMFYNKYFPGAQIAMVPPLAADAVEYQDGTKATVAQMAKDVTTFLAWAAEPELEERKSMGRSVILFLLVLTALLYALKRKIWSDLH
ncbi:MAG: cytochrome c1 [Alphaproteobacteria bacterium]|nr:MAG: cytochrome c1 [Alphaproteobacteria bacterium]